MYLHKDKETFKEIIEQVADDTGCAAVVIEKDYYVTMVKIQENEWEKIVLQENVWQNNIKWVICKQNNNFYGACRMAASPENGGMTCKH